jgi:hypothetical protein
MIYLSFSGRALLQTVTLVSAFSCFLRAGDTTGRSASASHTTALRPVVCRRR